MAAAPRTQPRRPPLAPRTTDRGLDPVPVTDLTAAEIRERLDELDAILATAPPDQTRILDALHTGQLTPADLDHAIADALATQDTRRDWILEHWPHVIEHAELSRLAAQHGPLDHWPLPLPAAAQHLHDQLATISRDTPEPRTLTELDAELAAADPAHPPRPTPRPTRHPRPTAPRPARRTGQLTEHPTGPPTSTTTSPNSADAPRPRPTNSTAHNAKASPVGRPDTGPNTSSTPSPDAATTSPTAPSPTANPGSPKPSAPGTPATPTTPTSTDSTALIIEIAAYRERSGHTGADPLGPAPRPDHPLHDRWQRLHHDLATAPPAAPTVSPIGR